MANDQIPIVTLLHAGKWGEAQALAHSQFPAAAGYADQYPGVTAVALALEALADAGLGHEAPARCRWEAAQSLDPHLAKADLSSFGAPGFLLKGRPVEILPREDDPHSEDLLRLSPGVKTAGGVQAPEYISRVLPEYPLLARQSKQEGKVVVQAIIERDGSVSYPRILEHQPLGLDASALYAICGWQFKPATLEGKPVRVFYVLTVNFKL
jgi:TonB family protein